MLRPPPVWKTGALLNELDPDLVPSSGNDPEPPGFQPGAQTIYAITAAWSRRWGSNPTLPLYHSGAQTCYSGIGADDRSCICTTSRSQTPRACASACSATSASDGADHRSCTCTGAHHAHWLLGPARLLVPPDPHDGGARGARTRNLSCAIAALSHLS